MDNPTTEEIIAWLRKGKVSVEDITPKQMKVLTKYWGLDKT